jgi:hypothetical protein
MKKYLLTILILNISVVTLSAQWNGTSPMYTFSNVGIGTSGPNAKLEVLGGDILASSGMLMSNLTGATQIRLNSVGANYGTIQNNAANLWSLGFKTTTTNALGTGVIFWNSTGNAGIGTPTPNAKLEVSGGDILATNGMFISSLYGATQIRLNSVGANYGTIQNDAANSWSLGFKTTTNNSLGTGVIFWNSTGNAGIGTPAPNAKLEVSGGDILATNGMLMSNLAGATQVRLNSAGANYGTIQNNAANLWSLGYKTTTDNSLGTGVIFWNATGNVGIGTNGPDYKLDVCGTIRAKEIKVDLLGGCDFVFDRDYPLMDLKELQEFVMTNHHLPGIASEKEMIEQGLNVKEFQMKLLQKVEELTLYTIAQNKKIEQQNDRTTLLEEQNELLKQEIKLLKQRR